MRRLVNPGLMASALLVGAAVASATGNEHVSELQLARIASVSLSQVVDELAIAPDLDRDGLPEILVSRKDNEQQDGAFFAVVSPGRRAVLYCYQDFRAERPSQLLSGLAFGPDVDGDGAADLVVSAPGRRRVSLLSGRSGRLLRSWSAAVPGFGGSLAFGATGGKDAEPVVAVGAPEARTVQVFSARSGARLAELKDRRPGFGRALEWGEAPTPESRTLAIGAKGELTLWSLASKTPVARIHPPDNLEDWPAKLSFVDVNGDGVLELVAGETVFDARDGHEIAAYLGGPVPNGQHAARWLYRCSDQTRWCIGRPATPSESRSVPSVRFGLLTLATLPEDLDPASKAFGFDRSGRWWATTGKHGDSPHIVTLLSEGRPPFVEQPVAELPLDFDSCPLLWEPAVDYRKLEQDARPLLEKLAAGLESLGKAPRRERQVAQAGLLPVADPQAGLWFWQNYNIASEPTLHFPNARWPKDQRAEQVGSALQEAAELVRKLHSSASLPAGAVRHGSIALRKLLQLQFLYGKALPGKPLTALPVELSVSMTDGSPDAPAKIEVFFTLRNGRLYLAHVVYHDGSA